MSSSREMTVVVVLSHVNMFVTITRQENFKGIVLERMVLIVVVLIC